MKSIELNEPIIYINPFTLQKVTLTKLSVCNKAFHSLIPDICKELNKTLQDIEQVGFEIDAPCMLDPHWYNPIRGKVNGRMQTKTFDHNYWRKLDWGIKFKNYPWVFYIEISCKTDGTDMRVEVTKEYIERTEGWSEGKRRYYKC